MIYHALWSDGISLLFQPLITDPNTHYKVYDISDNTIHNVTTTTWKDALHNLQRSVSKGECTLTELPHYTFDEVREHYPEYFI